MAKPEHEKGYLVIAFLSYVKEHPGVHYSKLVEGLKNVVPNPRTVSKLDDVFSDRDYIETHWVKDENKWGRGFFLTDFGEQFLEHILKVKKERSAA